MWEIIIIVLIILILMLILLVMIGGSMVMGLLFTVKAPILQ